MIEENDINYVNGNKWKEEKDDQRRWTTQMTRDGLEIGLFEKESWRGDVRWYHKKLWKISEAVFGAHFFIQQHGAKFIQISVKK